MESRKKTKLLRHPRPHLWMMTLLTLKISCHQDDKKLTISRSYLSVASTIMMIVVSLLPYLDLLISPFLNTNNIKMNRFPNLSTAIWSYSMCVSPLLILLFSKFKPYWFAYIVPIYVYTTMICGFLFLDLNIHIKSDWVFRMITLILSIILMTITFLMMRIFKIVRLKEDVMNEYIKLKSNG